MASCRLVPIALHDTWGRYPGAGIFLLEPLYCSADNRRVFVATAPDRTGATMLLEIDVTTGVLRMPIAEPTNGFLKLGAELYKQPNSRIIAGGSQAIWYSERSGFGHLYMYELTTADMINPITAGEWPALGRAHV